MGVRPKGYCNLQKGSDFFVRFWGTRGSIPCPGESYTRYGGNTSCIEVRCGDKLLIFDAGTGLRPLGKQLCQNRTEERRAGRERVRKCGVRRWRVDKNKKKKRTK